MFHFIRLYVAVFAIGILHSSCSSKIEAGFFSSDIRVVQSNSESTDSIENPVLKDGQVINENLLFRENRLSGAYKLNAWRGERVHVQVAIKSEPSSKPVLITLSPLVNENGDEISPAQIKVRRSGFVITDEFRSGCGHRPEPSAFFSSRISDPLYDLNSNTSDSLSKNGSLTYYWITIAIPATAKPGNYHAHVNTGGKDPLELDVAVSNRQLPPPASWSFDLDLWQHPAAIARVHNVGLWSGEHYELMRPYFQMLASAGQKNITTSIVHEPWGHQTFDDFPSLIKWIKKSDDSWSFDYTRFDEYVEFVMSCGITSRINCYSIIPWKMMVQYYDEALQKDTSIATEMGTKAYAATWKPMLQDFTRHLKEKNWFSKTTIAMDERPMAAMKTAISLLKSIDPEWKIALAGEYHPEIEKDIYDYCVASRWILDSSLLQKRKSAGMPTTVYTCCTEAYPNGFSFSPPAEHVFLGWYAQAKGFTGYLRWAYNSWTKDPLNDSRYTAWPAGDTYQIYPGPTGSIRFEKLIEGIQDFEKINFLKEEWTKEGNDEKLAKLKIILEKFEIQALEKGSAETIVAAAKKALLELE